MHNTRTTNGIVRKHTSLSPQEIAKLLDSDDELPDSYVETAHIPAYLDDNRFAKQDEYYGKQKSQVKPEEQSHIEKAVEEISTEYRSCSELSQVSQPTDISDQRHQIDTTELSNKKTLVTKGFFTKHDIFLIKSIEEYSTDTNLLWFINYLSSKLVKPTQRSCLVQDITSAHFTAYRF